MKKKFYGLLVLLLVVIVSIAIVIIPTFFTKNISRISLHKEFNLPLILNDNKDIKLLFFGYSGCDKVCAPRLYDLDKFYNSLEADSKQRVGIEFLDISVPDDKTLPEKFALYFNKEFKGIYLNKNILRDYTKVFNVFFNKTLMDKTEYDHTANLYLIKKTADKKEVRYIYNAYPYDFKQIKLDIEELLHE